MDLAQVDKLASSNSGIKYLMVIVDLFSRYVRVGPMRTKSAESAKACFIKLCSKNSSLVFPKKLWIDSGKEFLADFKDFCEDAGISLYSIHSEKKALLAERYIRTLKNILYRYMEEMKIEKYLPVLQQFVKTMNSRTNRSTGIPPELVKIGIFLQVSCSNRSLPKKRKPKFTIGDKVRLAFDNFSFRKGYKSQFTEEVFRVQKLATIQPVPTYLLENLGTGKQMEGKYYEQEIEKVI